MTLVQRMENLNQRLKNLNHNIFKQVNSRLTSDPYAGTTDQMTLLSEVFRNLHRQTVEIRQTS